MRFFLTVAVVYRFCRGKNKSIFAQRYSPKSPAESTKHTNVLAGKTKIKTNVKRREKYMKLCGFSGLAKNGMMRYTGNTKTNVKEKEWHRVFALSVTCDDSSPKGSALGSSRKLYLYARASPLERLPPVGG